MKGVVSVGLVVRKRRMKGVVRVGLENRIDYSEQI
jgi:hypothetical protein